MQLSMNLLGRQGSAICMELYLFIHVICTYKNAIRKIKIMLFNVYLKTIFQKI